MPTLQGMKEVVVKAGTQPGDRLRMRGYGIPKPNGGRGDQFVQIQVVLPRILTHRQRQLLEEFAEESGNKREFAA